MDTLAARGPVRHERKQAVSQLSANQDLTPYSSFFPDAPVPEIPRHAYVNLLKNMFTASQRVVIVEGPPGAGKTTVLSQFVRLQPERCISFFVGRGYETSNPRAFLLDVSEQLEHVLRDESDSLDGYPTDRLRQRYYDLLRKLARSARTEAQPFYLVIDGLEWLDEKLEEQGILELLPKDLPLNVHMLVSSNSGQRLPFSGAIVPALTFELPDTAAYLGALLDRGQLNQDEVRQIHERCGGFPGYIDTFRRLAATSGLRPAQLSSELPESLQDLVALEWHRLASVCSAQTLEALGLLAFSRASLSLEDLTRVTGCDETDLRADLSRASFLRVGNDGQIQFVADVVKDFIAETLRAQREKAEAALINYYQEHQDDKTAFELLPRYLARPEHYELLKQLVTSDYLGRGIRTFNDTTSLRRTLRSAAGLAMRAMDGTTLIQYVLASSLLSTLANQPAAEEEVEALLRLENYVEASQVASRALLPEDRLQLQARVYRRMRRQGVPIPADSYAALEQFASDIDASHLQDRAIEIAADLFDLVPQAAVSLVERSTGVGSSERSLDWARALLAIRLEYESEEVDVPEAIRSRITDQALREFSSAHSLTTGRRSPDEVIAEADRIDSTSGKVLLLRIWCNANRSNPLAEPVIKRALEVILTDQEYGTSVRLLRQLAEPLRNVEASQLTESMDLLRLAHRTSKREPIEEDVRFELLMAELYGRHDPEEAINRSIEVYYRIISDIQDSDVQTYCFSHLVLTQGRLDPDDTRGFSSEFKEALTSAVTKLLEGSAEQWAVVRRSLRALAPRHPHLALEIASKLNTSLRRDTAIRAVVWRLAEDDSKDPEVDFMASAIELLSQDEVDRRSYTIVGFVERLSRHWSPPHEALQSLVKLIDSIQEPTLRCYGCALLLNASENSESSDVEHLRTGLLNALEQVDGTWNRVSLGFNLATTVGSSFPDLAQALVGKSREERVAHVLARDDIVGIYSSAVKLALRAFCGLLGSGDLYIPAREQLRRVIEQLPSYSTQSVLLSDLALKLRDGGRLDEFESTVTESLLPSLSQIQDRAAKTHALKHAGPCLYAYERTIFMESLSDLNLSERDKVLYNTLVYVLTKQIPGDPLNLEELNVVVDVRSIGQARELIEAMTGDEIVASSIDLLVSSLLKPEPNPRNQRAEVCPAVIERNVVATADGLERIARNALPDKRNIQHNGYLVLALSSLHRLRIAATRRTKTESSWANVIGDAKHVPNVADRVLVLTRISKDASHSDMSAARSAASLAESELMHVPDALDRIERLHSVASTWYALGEEETAKNLVRTLFQLLPGIESEERRDVLGRAAIRLAHSISPEFASDLTPLVDNPLQEHKSRLALLAEDIKKRPALVAQRAEDKVGGIHETLGDAARDLQASLNAGSGALKRDEDLLPWIHSMLDSEFDNVNDVVSLFLENATRQKRPTDYYLQTFSSVVRFLDLCLSVAAHVAGSSVATLPIADLKYQPGGRLFPAGSRDKAVLSLQQWFSDHGNKYVKVYDPYFSADDLNLLRFVQDECSAFIVTRWPVKFVKVGDRGGVEKFYRDAWEKFSPEPPPQTQIVVIGTAPDGESPLHDRYFISSDGGLALGTSLSGLGNKDSGMLPLADDARAEIETRYVDIWLMPVQTTYKGVPLLRHMFML